MNRRDMIIVATLMNTGLLAILFMMAIQTETQGSTEVTTAPPTIDNSLVAHATYTAEEPKPILPHEPTVPVAKTSRHDELDKVISNFANVVPPKPIILDDDLFVEEVKETHRSNQETETARVGNLDTSSDLVEVTVKRGDSLDKIARANKTTVKAIKRANNLSSDKLQIGQVLRIPENTNVAAPAPAVEIPAVKAIVQASKDVEYYTLKNGDNPWKIAKQFGVRFEQLLQLNGLDEAKARRLKAGDKIRVR